MLLIIVEYKHGGQEVISIACKRVLLKWDVQVQGQVVVCVNGKNRRAFKVLYYLDFIWQISFTVK